MTDPTTFEARLVASLDRYADRMPVAVDAHQLTLDLARTRAPSGMRARRWATTWPSVRVMLLLGLVAVLVLGVMLVAGRLVRDPRPSPINGPLMLTTHGDPAQVQIVAPDGSGHTTVEVGSPWHCPHLLPGGDRIAYWTSFGLLKVVSTDGTAPTIVDRTPFRDSPEGGSGWDGDVWSADQGQVALPIDGVRIVDMVHGTIRQIPVSDVVAMAWAPNGELTIARQLSGEVQLSNIGPDDTVGPEIIRYAWDATTMGQPSFGWSPTGTHLAYLVDRSLSDQTRSSDVVIVQIESGSRSTVARGVESFFDPAAIFSPDGRKIAMATPQGFVVEDPDGTTAVTIDPIAAAPWALVGWSPDGSWIALSAGGRNVVVHPDGSGLVKLTARLSSLALSRGGSPGQLTWAPDSSMLAFMNHGYSTHSVSTFHVDGTDGSTIADFEAQGGGMNCLAWPAVEVP